MSSLEIPDDRSYTADHEWVTLLPGAEIPESEVRIGLTSVAVDQLGELVYLDLPEIGTTITAGQTCGEVESTKTVADVVAPVTGEVTLINSAAVDDPGLVSSDPYGQGWLFAVRPQQFSELLTAHEYAAQNGVQP